ncbi:hypothetical protein BVD88_09995 [Neisseria meningitidis]|nr:hypothetical protein BVD88_09995 [Neisseria meningitidis]
MSSFISSPPCSENKYYSVLKKQDEAYNLRDSAFRAQTVKYSGLTKTGTALPRLSSKRTIL